MSKKIKIALIEDIEELRKDLERFLRAQEEFNFICSAASVEDFITELDTLEIKPDIIISDIGLPGLSGIEGIAPIRKLAPLAEFMMISVLTDTDNIYKALCAGAVGYLIKNTAPNELKKAILTVNEGGSPMSPSIARKVISHFTPRKQTEDQLLTPKEEQIVQCIVEGLSYKLIADRLSISINTVRQHIRHIYKKLQVNSKAEVIAMSLNK